MRRLEIGCMAAGGALIVACAALIFWPAAVGVAGALLVAAGWPKDPA